MRITTQMLNRSAQKAGLPTNRTSLLNYINGNNSNVSLANTLSKTSKEADTKKKSDYEKLEKSADQTAASAEKLLSTGSENVSSSDLQTFVDKYNDMLKNLGKSSDTLNMLYAQTAKDTVKEYKKELAELGITVEKNSTLSFNKAKFEKFKAELAANEAAGNISEGNASEAGSAAEGTQQQPDSSQEETDATETAQEPSDAESSKTAASAIAAKLNALFAEGGLFSKLSFLASRVSDYADANAESYSGYYNAAGSRTNAYTSGKYNFWS